MNIHRAKSAGIVLCVCLVGCFYIGKDQYEDVLKKPSSEWSSRDCLTVVLSAMSNNFSDPSTCIRVVATPYYPAVIAALGRLSQQKAHATESHYEHDMDTLLKAQVGLFMDWDKGALVDARGNYFRERTQIDSLMFLVTVRNTSTCNVPYVVAKTRMGYQYVPLSSPGVWPCYLPDITDLEKHIFLQNDSNKTLEPRYVWGKRHNQLTQDETLLVMFPLREKQGHFLEGSEHFYLIIHGFVQDIKLQFTVSDIR